MQFAQCYGAFLSPSAQVALSWKIMLLQLLIHLLHLLFVIVTRGASITMRFGVAMPLTWRSLPYTSL
jgi:hypothetical protein